MRDGVLEDRVPEDGVLEDRVPEDGTKRWDLSGPVFLSRKNRWDKKMWVSVFLVLVFLLFLCFPSSEHLWSYWRLYGGQRFEPSAKGSVRFRLRGTT